MLKKVFLLMIIWLGVSVAYSFFYLYPQASTIIKFFKTHSRFKDLSKAKKHCPIYNGGSRSECFLEYMSSLNILEENDPSTAAMMLHFNFFVVARKESKEISDPTQSFKHKQLVVKAALRSLENLKKIQGRFPASAPGATRNIESRSSEFRQKFYKKLRADYVARTKKLIEAIQVSTTIIESEKSILANETMGLLDEIENMPEIL